MRNRYGSLSELSFHSSGRIEEISLEPLMKQRLISMGLCYGKNVEKMVDSGGCLLVRAGNLRLAISKEIADKINLEYNE